MTGTLRTALVAALVVVIVAGAAVAYCAVTDTPLPWQSAETPTRFLLIAGSPDDTGAVIAQVIVIVDTAEQTLTAIAPDTPATIPGTSYSELKDALPFGGGAAVARTYAEVSGAPVLPYITIRPGGLVRAVDGLATIRVTLPAGMDVFDGDRLYSFPAGPRTVSGVEFAAVVKGRPYLTSRQQKQLDDSLAEALACVAAGWPGGMQAAVESGEIDTGLTAESLGVLKGELARFAR
ncbi:MAG: LCP family protein [Coriobacteriia bacterium]|nr:LCP family protein [Coriobacteriia bacterium]